MGFFKNFISLALPGSASRGGINKNVSLNAGIVVPTPIYNNRIYSLEMRYVDRNKQI